ncbi:hypothetical protein TNCV_3736731 [Trichonephila clavipes]|nr:hypothetical protein TNCV_3736731 [Trichonephila clavipes]
MDFCSSFVVHPQYWIRSALRLLNASTSSDPNETPRHFSNDCKVGETVGSLVDLSIITSKNPVFHRLAAVDLSVFVKSPRKFPSSSIVVSLVVT